ncbi:MAG: PQQ-dependent sugar dehydrogenase [Patescibacteria group bacterium]
MPRHFLKSNLVLATVIALSAVAGTASAHGGPLLEGTLVHSLQDPKVYFIQGGQKRWVTTEAAFSAQGFRWSDVNTVDQHQLDEQPEGEAISSTSPLGLPIDHSLLPDLAPVAPYDLRYAVEDGRTRLRFTATFWNRGKGALELHTDDPAAANAAVDSSFNAFQRIFHADGTTADRPVGILFWHEIHNHFHYDDFGHYTLELVRPAVIGASVAQTMTEKTTFCMRDDEAIGAPADGAKQGRKYMGCGGGTQGVSIGWADVYPSTLPDQFFDVTGFPAGVYKLTFSVDPDASFAETRRDNNVSATLVELDPEKKTLKLVGTASAYPTPNTQFQDGTLIRADGDSRIYVMHSNKKRLLKTAQVFASYGYADKDVYTLPAGAVASIPNDKLVRVTGTSAIYLLNDTGYRRKILNPQVMSSYGWTGVDVASISQTELESYPETALIWRESDAQVLSISDGRAVGTWATLRASGYDSDSVHLVNTTDFLSYAAKTIQTGLNVPWDIAFLPDGQMLVTERPGTLRRIGQHPFSFPIPAVAGAGEGGLMGIALHPDFTSNHLVYLYYTTNDPLRNKIARFRLDEDKLTFDKVILDSIPSAIYHDGGQVTFGPDGMLYLTTGDANTSENAQNISSLAGKTLRLTPEGGIPSDNPFGTAIWSYGHRNAQGIAWDAQGRMWQTEHGRSGAVSGYDELNLIEKGKNYGWPTIEGGETRAGMVTPAKNSSSVVTWAPSGIAYVNGTLFFAGLRGESLYAADVNAEGAITSFRQYFQGTYGRLRGVVVGTDGFLYLTTSNRDDRGTPRAGDDKIIRVSPAFLK